MGCYYLFNVTESGDKELVGQFEGEQEALDAVSPERAQSLEVESLLGKRVIFSPDRAAQEQQSG